MKVSVDQLERELARGQKAAWLVSGDEPLGVGEAADAVRAKARELGFTEREVFDVARGFDWSTLLQSSQSLSLFATRRLIEVRLAGAKPGAEGGKLLAQLAADPGPDTWILVVSGRLDRDAQSSAWVKAFDAHGVVAQAWPVEIDRLPQWIQGRAKRVGLDMDLDGARLIAERVEGNLLAAHQEILKLELLHGAGRVDLDAVAAAVADSARYDVFQLGEAALAGDAGRALRVLEGLRAEGTEPVLVLWALARDLRAVAGVQAGRALPTFNKSAERYAGIASAAARRMGRRRVESLLVQAGRVDRAIKGIERGNAWLELTALVAAMAGLRPLVARTGRA